MVLGRIGWLWMMLCWVGLTGLSGCSTVAWEAAKKLRENRVTEAQFTDSKIAASVMADLADLGFGMWMDVNADVWENRVLLTGMVTDYATRREVVRKVQADKRIRKVYNEIQVVSAADQAKRRAARASAKDTGATLPDNDFWVETKIGAKLVAAQEVISVNYRWRSVRNILYLIGSAQSKQELKQVLALIKDTDGVARVKSFVDINVD